MNPNPERTSLPPRIILFAEHSASSRSSRATLQTSSYRFPWGTNGLLHQPLWSSACAAWYSKDVLISNGRTEFLKRTGTSRRSDGRLLLPCCRRLLLRIKLRTWRKTKRQNIYTLTMPTMTRPCRKFISERPWEARSCLYWHQFHKSTSHFEMLTEI